MQDVNEARDEYSPTKILHNGKLLTQHLPTEMTLSCLEVEFGRRGEHKGVGI
jgi:hypothetical protein